MNKIHIILLFVAIFGFVGFILTNDCSVCACVICENDLVNNPRNDLNNNSINNFVNDSSSRIFESVSPSDFDSLLSEDVVLLDIRTSQEFDSGHIEEAISIDFYSSSFKSDIKSLDKTRTYLIYCRSGSRSSNALNMMEELGFKEVYDLRGGINKWKTSGFSVISS